jgi:oxygen-independent coproporphyrinogen-3 oxidase
LKQRERGDVEPVGEDTERLMYEHVMDRLESQGLRLYEISNYARPGHESRHNLVYWANDAYYGLGLGAAQYREGVRTVNTREMSAYLKRIESGLPAIGPKERLEPEERAHETAMLMLRRTLIGLDRDDFRTRTGFDLDALVGPVVDRFVREGLLEDDGRRIRLTREGRFLADRVLCEIV